jgi:bifunctional UDP-N-acetylglucosamine pyrophosphorylase/glucosamine-1-phosphate N-acetyltransferase
VAVAVPEEEVQGVNDRVQLAAAEGAMQQRLRRAAMAAGVTMIAPETVFLSHDTGARAGRDHRAERLLRPWTSQSKTA